MNATHLNVGYTYSIEVDEHPESPRDMFSQLGEILYVSNRYVLGDKEVDRYSLQEFIENDEGYIWLPVYAYIHSGVMLSTGAFSCPWDSGQCGVIRVSEEKILEDFGVQDISNELRETVKDGLRGEIEELGAKPGR